MFVRSKIDFAHYYSDADDAAASDLLIQRICLGVQSKTLVFRARHLWGGYDEHTLRRTGEDVYIPDIVDDQLSAAQTRRSGQLR